MGVVKMYVWLVGGVVRMYLYRFSHNITYSYSTCTSSFFQHHPDFFVHFLNVVLFLFRIFWCNIANVAQRTIEIFQKSKSRKHGDIITSTRTYVHCARESQDFHEQGTV